jgi:hypothetical protein
VQPTPPVPSQPAAELYFSDLDADVSLDLDDAETQAPAQATPVDFHSPGVYVAPPSDPKVYWPAGISTAAEAEDGLQRALHGAADGARPLHDLAMRTLESLSDLERAVLSGEPQPIDTAPIRKAAVMRLRVAEALASVPPPGSSVDSTAVSAVLSEIDGLLAEVSLVSGAPQELPPALEEIRNALVREAIDFSEAASRVAAQPAEPSAAPVTRPAVRGARVLSVTSVPVEDSRWSAKTIALVVLLVLVALGVGAYHVRRMMPRPVTALKTLAGAPAGTVGTTNRGIQILTRLPGKTIDPAELERFKAAQEAKGNTVQEIAPGTWHVQPAGAKGEKP